MLLLFIIPQIFPLESVHFVFKNTKMLYSHMILL